MNNIEKQHIEDYLVSVKNLVKQGRYQIALGDNREANTDLFYTYKIEESDAREILLSISVEDFSEIVQNRKQGYTHEKLYIFGKTVELNERFGYSTVQVKLYIKINKIDNQYVVVISFHEQKYDLDYPFK